MPNQSVPTTQQLREALEVSAQIEKLQSRLSQIFGSSSTSSSAAAPAKRGPGRPRGTMSAAGRARIGAAARARWAKIRAESKSSSKPVGQPKAKKKGGITAEGRARLAAAMKARWAARKKAGN